LTLIKQKTNIYKTHVETNSSTCPVRKQVL